jgi:hypothetical protein
MQRGKPVAEGFVNFPFNSLEFNEGGGMGLYVKLVVLDMVEGTDTSLAMCCGASVFDFRQGPMTGDDQRPVPADKDLAGMTPEEIVADMDADVRVYNEWVQFHFPMYASGETLENVSRHYRASILMGSTGWCGYSTKKGNWVARFDDLTDEGKDLYRMMGKLNPGCAIHLLTFLDT